MNEDDVVGLVLDRLEKLGLEYMVVGSYASNVYGRPRSSFDADIVVRLGLGQVDRFIVAFQQDFVIEAEPVRQAVSSGTMFNLIPTSGIFKVDIIPVRRTAYAQEEFGRRRQVSALGRTVWVASPEDVLLYKLVWYRRGGEVSGRQVEDARDVYALNRGAIDEAYLDRWADDLGVRDLLDRTRHGA